MGGKRKNTETRPRPAEAAAGGGRCAGFIPLRHRLTGPGHVPAELPPPNASLRGRRLSEPSLRRRGPYAPLAAGLREPTLHAALRPPAWAILAPRPQLPRRRRAVREPVTGGPDPAQAAEHQPPLPGSLRRQIPGRSCPAAAQALARGLPEALPGMEQGGEGDRPAPPHGGAGGGELLLLLRGALRGGHSEVVWQGAASVPSTAIFREEGGLHRTGQHLSSPPHPPTHPLERLERPQLWQLRDQEREEGPRSGRGLL